MRSLEELQRLLEPLFPGLMGVRLTEATPTRVVATLEVRPELCTAGRILHGGAHMAFADTLGAVGTLLNLPPGKRTTTTDSSTKFIGAAPAGSTVSGECVAMHRGRTTMVWQTSIRTAEGRLCSVVTQTQLVLDGAGADSRRHALPGADYAAAAAAMDNRGMETTYAQTEPSRAEVDALAGATVLEFGTPWCGWCRAAQPLIADALASHPGVRHLKIEDGPGRPLGRSFRVKLWPTLIFLKDGQEVDRVTRPASKEQVGEALQQIDPRP